MRKALPIVAGLLLGMGTVPSAVRAQWSAPREPGPAARFGVARSAAPVPRFGVARSAPVLRFGPIVSVPPVRWKWRYRSAPLRIARPIRTPDLATATVLSAVLPGAGQHILGQRRQWAYLALEALGWFLYVDRRSAGSDFRRQYRDFAWNEARRQSGPRVDGDFAYYERLTKWERSGAFDADPVAAGVQPEMDAAAFNGSIWSLAKQLFLPGGQAIPESDPRYQRALEYYGARAYGVAFLWDWTGTGGAQDDFARLIIRSDERFRQATNVMGAIIANHVISAVDAYLTARGVGTPVEARIVSAPGASGTRWSLRVSIGTR
jgi:hypothetical protein